MKVSTKGRYAVRVMVDLALHNTGEFISLKEIAARQDITVKYLEQIIGMLNRSGLLQSLRGNNGGYRLAKQPEDIRVGDVLRITEGEITLAPCLEAGGLECEKSAECSSMTFWTGLDKVIAEYVDSFTIADLMNQSQASNWDNYVI